jgi:RNase P subunit RPR2
VSEMKERIDQMTKIAVAITHGDLSEINTLVCPYCGSPSLVFSFTVREPPDYGLYVVCKACRHITHFSLNEKPPNFREELVIEEFQRLEDEARRRASELNLKK